MPKFSVPQHILVIRDTDEDYHQINCFDINLRMIHCSNKAYIIYFSNWRFSEGRGIELHCCSPPFRWVVWFISWKHCHAIFFNTVYLCALVALMFKYHLNAVKLILRFCHRALWHCFSVAKLSQLCLHCGWQFITKYRLSQMSILSTYLESLQDMLCITKLLAQRKRCPMLSCRCALYLISWLKCLAGYRGSILYYRNDSLLTRKEGSGQATIEFWMIVPGTRAADA